MNFKVGDVVQLSDWWDDNSVFRDLSYSFAHIKGIHSGLCIFSYSKSNTAQISIASMEELFLPLEQHDIKRNENTSDSF